MAGHSHWATIKHKKAAVDAKRGKMWSKLSKAIIVAAKHGGGDPDMNLRLRAAIDAAKAVSLPKENIQRAINRGTGEGEASNFEEVVYEGYAAGGVAVMAEVLTDTQPHIGNPQDLRSPGVNWAPPAASPGCSARKAYRARPQGRETS